MTPIKQRSYEFKSTSLGEIRKKMGLTQTKMAQFLGVPQNTLSRWETGETSPDAKSLAAFYSLAMEYGITPEFFGPRVGPKYNLLVYWDFQTAGVPAGWTRFSHDSLLVEIRKRLGGITPLYKAFTHPDQSQAAAELKKLGWRISEGGDEVADWITDDAKSDSGHNPASTVVVLISNDSAFADLITDLQSRGVQVFVVSSQSLSLYQKVDTNHIIPWYPIGLEAPKRRINQEPNLISFDWQTNLPGSLSQ